MAIEMPHTGQGQELKPRLPRKFPRRKLLAAAGAAAAFGTAYGIGKAFSIPMPGIAKDGNGDGSSPSNNPGDGNGNQQIGADSTPTATITPEHTPTVTSTEVVRDPSSLRELAKKSGLTVGCELTGNWFSDAKWKEIVGNQFNVGQIEWGLHWNEVEPAKGKFDFSVVDRLVDFGRKNDMKLSGQNLIWGNQNFIPKWLSNGNFSRDEMETIFRNHISQIIRRYKGVVDEWVVVNEAYKYPDRVRKEDIFMDTLGRDYIRIAFDEAKKSNSDATLIYNDTHNDMGNGVTTKLNKGIIESLRAAGFVDDKFVLGVQGHKKGGVNFSTMDVTDTLRSYGIDRIKLTEFDVDMTGVQGSVEERGEIEAQKYSSFLHAVYDSGLCRDFSFQGIGDKNNWLVRGGSPDASPTMFDDNLNPKPAFRAVQDFLANIVSK